MAGWADAIAGGLNLIGQAGQAYGAYSSANKNAANANALNQFLAQLASANYGMGVQQYQDDAALRNRILGKSDDLQSALMTLYNMMGPSGQSLFDPRAVETEAQRRLPSYIANIMSQLNLVNSQEKADLMRRGMDRSTFGAIVEAEAAARGGRALNDAYTKSFEDALKYITGIESATWAGMDQAAKSRAGALSELSSLYTGPLTAELGLYKPGSGLAMANASTSPFAALLKGAEEKASSSATALGRIIEGLGKNTGPALNNIVTALSGNAGTNPYPTGWGTMTGAEKDAMYRPWG